MADTPAAHKPALRKRLRAAREARVAALPDATRALLFRRPPAPILALVPDGAIVGLYNAAPAEAPAGGYARHFAEAGHRLALPRMASRGAAMEFALHTDPFGASDLVAGPYGIAQPAPEAPSLVPDILFVPLVGFTVEGQRLGQGGGHYDRWLAAHPHVPAVGLAWDAQLVDWLPLEPHDRPLTAVVTPTRFYGPFA